MNRLTADLFDIRTLFISELLIMTVVSVMLLLVYRFHGKKFRGIGNWAFGSILQTAGFLLLALRDILPNPLSILLTNAFLLFAAALMYTCIEEIQDGKRRSILPYVLAGAATLAQLHFTFVRPDLGWRILVLSSASIVILALCITRFLRPNQPGLWPVIVPVASLALFAAVAVFRIVMTVLYPPGTNLLYSGTAQAVSIMGYIVGTTGWTSGLILVISWKLKIEEERLAETNRMLIREMHHRIKNNLATLRALLNIQASLSETEELKSALAKSSNRIDAIAKIHDLLHMSEDVSLASLRLYIENLVRSIEESFSNQGVRVELDVEDLHLSINTLIPLGLIINELVTNSFEHGFPGGGTGRIGISFRSSGGDYRLTVEDDGAGFLADADKISGFSSLGMKIVDSLVRQLKGTLTIRTKPATSVEIVFGKQDQDPRRSPASSSAGLQTNRGP